MTPRESRDPENIRSLVSLTGVGLVSYRIEPTRLMSVVSATALLLLSHAGEYVDGAGARFLTCFDLVARKQLWQINLNDAGQGGYHGAQFSNDGRSILVGLSEAILELRSSDGTLIAANDNWMDTQFPEIYATGIPPSDDLESAIVETLANGAYTAIVRGVNDTTGVALVELYQLNAVSP